MNSLKDRITEAFAEKRGAKKAALAKAAKVTSSAVSQWFSGESQSMRLEPALGAAEYLGVNPLWLAEGKGPKKPITGQDQYKGCSAETRLLIDYLMEHPTVAEITWSMIRSVAGAETQLSSNQAGAKRPANDKWRGGQFTPGKAIQNEEHAGKTSRGKQRP